GHIFVAWPRFPALVRTRLIGYVWDPALPVGSIVKSRKTGTVTFVVVGSGAAGLGKWASQTRDVVEDYRMIYGEAPPHPHAVALSIDTNDTRRAPAARLAAHLEATVDAQEVPPGGRARLALEEIAEDDAVAPRVLASAGFQEVIGRWRRGRVEDRPAPRADGRAQGTCPARAQTLALLRVQEAPKAGEAVAGDETGRDQLAERFLHLDAQAADAPGDLVGERRAARAQVGQHVARGGRQRVLIGAGARLGPPAEVLAV